MLSRLPHEVRLQIFHCVFKSQYEYQEVIRVEDTAEGITYKFTNGVHRRTLSGAISCIDAAIVGEGIAAAAAEALYQSQFHFAVDAKVLCAFLQSCPLSLLVEPGKYIKKLHLYMDEDPKFIGDGKDGHALRKADWVDLVPDASDDRVTRLGHRTQRMRQCWRAILLMPKLKCFEFWIMPSQGKVSANDIQRWEIRDIIPTHFRLCRKRVRTSIYLRTWEDHRKPNDDLDYILDNWEYLSERNSAQESDDDGFYESYLDLDSCVPFHWIEPADYERILVENASTLPPWDGSHDSLKCHRVRNYEAMCEFKDRLIADKNYKYTREGKTRRKRKYSSGGTLIEAGSQEKSLLAHLALCASDVLTPSKTLPLALPNSSPNKSLSVVPSGFSLQAVVMHDPTLPLDEIAVYQNAVAAMEDLAFMNQSAELPLLAMHSWSLPQYDVSLDIVSTRVQWAVYGLQMTENIISGGVIVFQPCVGRFFWQGHYEGNVNFMRRVLVPNFLQGTHKAGTSDAPGLSDSYNKSSAGATRAADPLQTLLLTPDPDISIVTNASNRGTTPLDAPHLRVVPTYNGLPMTSKDIFTIALSTMVLGAEQGPETACSGIMGIALDVVPIIDAQGQPLLKYHSLIKAMRVLTTWMVAKNRFGEIDVELIRDGVVIAIGRLKKFNQALAGV